jgi:hypothetical protein
MFGIYAKLGRSEDYSVYLTDGCWTDEQSCNKPGEIVPLVPRLFVTKGGAKNHIAKAGLGNRCIVKKYAGR